MRRWVLVLTALSVLAACDGNGGVTAGSTTSTTAESSGSGSSTSTSVDPESTTTTTEAGQGSSCPANTNPQASDAVTPQAQLVAVRAAHQPGFDRIVFEFRGTAPGFRVEYGNKPVTQDGSGDEVPLRGRHALYVRMDNATSWDFEAERASYTGPKRIRPSDTTVVEELVQSGDFEGQLNWAIGTKSKEGFRVRKLTNPPRLMIEICAAP